MGFAQLLALTLSLTLSGCAATEHLPEGRILLKHDPTFSRSQQIEADTARKNPLDNLKEIGVSTVDGDLLASAVRTKANRRMLWPKTYLHLYQMGRSIQKYLYPPERIWKFFFPRSTLADTIAGFLVHTAGEPPVLVDTTLLAQDVENLKDVYFSQGFFDAQIYYKIDTCTWKVNRNKARVSFVVDEGPAAIIDTIRFEVGTPYVDTVLMATLQKSLLKKGDPYNENSLTAERNRITNAMRSHGFYTFSPKLISYDIDTKPDTNDLHNVRPNNPAIKDFYPIHIVVKIPDRQEFYDVGSVRMVIEPAEFDIDQDQAMVFAGPETPEDSLLAWGLSKRLYDSGNSRMTFFAYYRTLKAVNLNFLEKLVSLREGDIYSLENERKTQQRLQNLGIFKYVLVKHIMDQETRTVDVMINTVLLPKYQIKAGTEGFWESDPILKSNFPGAGAEIGLRDKLLFKGAEQLDLSAKGTISFFRSAPGARITPFLEGSGQASLRFPRFLIPGIGKKNWQRFDPKTSFTTTFSRQQSALYERNSLTLDWNYNWFHRSKDQRSQSSFSPYVVTFIQSRLDQVFVDRIKAIENAALRELIILDYRPRFSSWGTYKFTYANYRSTRRHPTVSVQPTVEVGGNTPFLIDLISGADGDWRDRKIFNIFYGQYVKLSNEVKLFLPMSKKSEFVIRNYIGLAEPWNFTPFVPFESRFFAGGINSMRGWQSNTLGPGTYNPTTADNTDALEFVVSPGGEFAFEANFEWRGHVNKLLELAIFTDIGNVWFLPGSEVDFAGAKLSGDSYLELGWDAGIGIRMDFDFLVARLDVAQQLYAPNIQDFVVKSFPRDLGGSGFQIIFGIGHPF